MEAPQLIKNLTSTLAGVAGDRSQALPLSPEPQPLQELTPAEILLARQAKTRQYEIERKRVEYFKKINTAYQYPEYTPGEYLELITYRGVRLQEKERWSYKFEIYKELRPYYELLAHYFLGLSTVQDYNILSVRDIALNKGIMLRGGYGIGKTVMMKLFAWNPTQCYDVSPVQKVVSVHDKFDKKADSEKYLEEMSKYYPLPYGSTQAIHVDNGYFGHTVLGLCFDDLGAEPLGNKFGAVNVMKRVLDNCYTNRHEHRKLSHTHIITNSSDEELCRSYDNRIVDRFNEMFNIIDLPEMESLR